MALLAVPMAIPTPALAGCGFMSFACDAASDTASSAWGKASGTASSAWEDTKTFGDYWMGPIDEMLRGDGILSARYEDSTEWDSMWIDGDGLRDSLIDFTGQFVQCVSNFEPTGTLSLVLLADEATGSRDLNESGAAAYAAAQADTGVQAFVKSNPQVVTEAIGKYGKVVPGVGKAIALINIKMAYDSCNKLVGFAEDIAAAAQPTMTTTAVTTTPTPTTTPSASPTPTPSSVPGGRTRKME